MADKQIVEDRQRSTDEMEFITAVRQGLFELDDVLIFCVNAFHC